MFRNNRMPYFLVALGLMLVSASAMPVGEFEQWKQQQQRSFQEYRDARDREFTAFLEEHWREVEMLKGFVRDEQPKPDVMPVARPRPPEPQPEPVPDRKPVAPPVEEAPPVPVKPEPEVIPPPPAPEPAPVPEQVQKGIRTQVDYFGTRITFYYDPALKLSLPYRLNEPAISRFWSGMSRADYEPLLEQLDRQARALQLNDWGYAVLTNRLAKRLYPSSENKQVLFSWFVLTKTGFDTRVAYDERRVFLLMPSRQQLYDVTYFTYGNERYYAVSLDGAVNRPGSVYTYDGRYPGADKKLDMVIRAKAAKGADIEKRTLSFEYAGRRHTIEAAYEKSRIDYLDTYPQLDLAVYFDSAVGEVAESPLLQQLADAIEGMSEQEAVNFLLRFVQTSFAYRVDASQFGRENYLFPEETIYYPYSDCEDRSVFFAWLVKSLLGLEVVGLNYPGRR